MSVLAKPDLWLVDEPQVVSESLIQPLGDRLTELGISAGHSDCDSRLLFGAAEQTQEMGRIGCGWQVGMWDLFHHLMGGEIQVVGSVNTLTEGNVATEGTFLSALSRIYGASTIGEPTWDYDTNILASYYRDELNIAGLPSEEYLVTQMLLGWQGGNATYIGNLSAKEDPGEVLDDMRKLIRLQASYPVDGGPRVLAQLSCFNKFNYLKIFENGTRGGIEIVLLPPAFDNSWDRMTNWRLTQSSTLGWQGSDGVVMEGISIPTEPIALEGEPGRLGAWWHHTARAIRSLVMHEKDASWMNVDTFLASRAQIEGRGATAWTIEDFVGVMANLVPARFENLELVDSLMNRLDIKPTIDTTGWWAQILQSAQERLWEAPLSLGREQRTEGEFGSLQELAPHIAAVMPQIDPARLLELVPRPMFRDQIRTFSIGSAGVRDPQVARDAMDVLRKRERQARSSGNQELAESLQEARQSIWMWKKNVGGRG